MKKIRVLRVMEYTYDNFELMINDMSRWAVSPNGQFNPTTHLSIKSATMPPEITEDTDNGSPTGS